MAKNLTSKVTVIMPVYNAAPFIKEAVTSILEQSFINFELLIIDDGSTDKSFGIMNSFTDNRIRIIRNIQNEGIVASRNKGIKNSSCEYIAMMDADDISLSERLTKQVDYLDRNKEISLVASKLSLINEMGDDIGTWYEDQAIFEESAIKNAMPIINCIGQSTVMIRKKVIESIQYNPRHFHSEDWGLWLSLLVEGYRIHKLNEVLVKYRVHSSSSTIIENKKGVRKKIIRFKLSYLKERITKRRFKYYDYKVLISLIKDFLKPIVPRFFYLMKRIYRKNPLKAIQQLFVLLLNYRRIKKAEYLFFFPFYHIGGAEKVHTAILETVSDKKSVTLITSLSENKAMYDAFSKLTKVIEINHLIEFTRINNWLIRKFELITNRNPKLVLFGCNSKFYYELLPFLPTNNKCIDLIHAFVHDNEIGAEHWSLPVVLRLTYRIVINSKVFEDIKFQYSINGINENLLNRVKVIENYVSIPDKMNKKDNNILQVLYVGRDSTEKRLYLIAAIARKCQEQNIKAKFIFVSNVLSFKKEDYIYCEFKGEIRNESILNELYKKADLLLLTSSREGFPMVIMEAMSYGVVPVSTNVGGISKHVEDHVNGLLFNSTKEADIIDEMTQAIAQLDVDRSSLNKMSANAFSYAKQNFSKEIFDIAYANILGKN